MKPLIIIQARTGSTRLPKKMIKPFFKGKTVLEILLERLKDSLGEENISGIVVATTDNIKDDAIVNICDKMGVKVYRGNENDVLQRFIDTADHYKADKIIRICADNVFLDPCALKTLCKYMSDSDYDYVSYRKKDGTPSILTHYGLFAEGVKLSALKDVAERTDEARFHEHVTNRIYTAQDIYRIKLMPMEEVVPDLENHDNLRLTLDTEEDFEIQQTIYTEMDDEGLELSPQGIITFIDENHPEFYAQMEKIINKNTK